MEKATKAIVLYRRMGFRIIASPDQWLLPVSPSLRSNPIQLSTDEQSAAVFQAGSVPTTYNNPKWEALCIRVNNRQVVLVPHEKYGDVTGSESEGVRFRGTPESCRWAYLLRTPRLELPAGEYILDLRIEISSGQLYGGVLDIEKNEFVVQQELQSETTRMQFALAEDRLIDVVIRQGAKDTPVSAIYRYGRLRVSTGVAEPADRRVRRGKSGGYRSGAAAGGAEHNIDAEKTPAMQASGIDSEKTGTPGLYKPGRIYCPMVYTTLSVFQHSLDVSICCYMETVPGERRSNLKDKPVLEAYNADGFKLVRRTLTTDQHLPVCDSCPYGAFRS